MRIRFVIAVLALLALFSGCESKKEENIQKENVAKNIVKEEPSNIEVKLKDVNGKEIVLKQVNNGFKMEGADGKILVVSFFATWCPPCKAEIPHLVSLQNKFKDKIVILGVLLEDNKPVEEVKSFIKYHNINYTVSVSEENFKLASLIGGVKSIPLLIIYDKDGNYVTHYLGAVPEEMMEADLRRVIERQ